MKVLAALLGLVLSAALLPGMAQASDPQPAWAAKAPSLDAAPAAIVRTAPKGQPLEVVVTRRTAHGPTFESVPAGSVESAKRAVGAAQAKSSTIAVSMARPVRMVGFVADPLRPQQWAHDVLRTSTAWRSSVGNGVTVAVVDTGVDAGHADLVGKVRTGYDFVSNDSHAGDANGHGTHVAGIIAAVAGNGRGIAGVTRGTRILPVRVLDGLGRGDTLGVARGITWAAGHGANVINLSLAFSDNGPDDSVAAAIAYARSRNVVVVAAAGNSPCPYETATTKVYPAAEAGVIGVGSIASTRQRSWFSCQGSWVDVVAPGSSIVSTMIGRPHAGLGCPAGSSTNNYCTLSGTSMATPYVAGAAALAIEEVGPTWRATGIESLLRTTATDLGPTGFDTGYGHGLINPSRMLLLINTHMALVTPRSTIVAGGLQTFSGRLLYSNNSPVVGARVRMSLTQHGQVETYTMTTSSTGWFSTRIRLIHNNTIAVRFAATGSQDDSSGSIRYSRVAPKWAVTHTRTRAYVTTYSIYGQTMALQKRSGTSWRTVASTKARSSKWSAAAGRGTWRIVSYANSSLAARISPSWSN